VHVDEVTEEGNMQLTITVGSLFMAKESAMLDIELLAERDSDGEVTVDVEMGMEMDVSVGLSAEDLTAVIDPLSLLIERRRPQPKTLGTQLVGLGEGQARTAQ